jgi:flavorubredoxin
MFTYKAADNIDVISANFPFPGYGIVPNNAFVLHGNEPILVDTGAGVHRAAFMEVLRTIIDVAALRWIWLTHPDPDHIGSLHELLRENPHLRVITTFLSVGILSASEPLPMDRVYLLNVGERLDLGDRSLFAFKPPAFDNAATTGFFEEKSGALFSSDCFGALLSEPAQNVEALNDQQLKESQTLWATIDTPWLHKVEPSLVLRELDMIRRMEPKMILSSHLPAAIGTHSVERILGALPGVPAAQPFVGPNQAALEQMLKQMNGGAQP